MKTFAITAALVAALSATSAFGQEIESYTEQQVADAAAAIEAVELTDAAYQNFWCGSAFLIINQLATNQGMTAEAQQAQGAADVLFGKAATEMIALGMPEPEFTALSQNFRIVAISQTGPNTEADYTQEECIAAAQAQ
jgi:hypothetical protein